MPTRGERRVSLLRRFPVYHPGVSSRRRHPHIHRQGRWLFWAGICAEAFRKPATRLRTTRRQDGRSCGWICSAVGAAPVSGSGYRKLTVIG